MLRRLFCLLCVIFSITVINAQEQVASQSEELIPSDFMMRVVVDSLNIRQLPTIDAERVGSLFESDIVYAVGRNIDGTWFEVQRPSKDTNAGWVARDFFSYMFDQTALPITDLSTGMIADAPVIDTGISTIVLTEAVLRTDPLLTASEITTIPAQRTIPVLTRTPDNFWLKVNYLGQVGWVAEFLLNTPAGVGNVPVDETLESSLLSPLAIIPPAIQRAQAERFIAYATPIRDEAAEVASFWSQLTEGLTIPCNPRASGFPLFSLTQQDLFELPELRRANRLVPTAIEDLNASIEAMQRCGVYTQVEIRTAYANAINANLILDNSIDLMELVLETIVE